MRRTVDREPRLGRPPLPDGVARSVKVLVSLTPAEAAAAQAKADAAGKPLAAWSRDVLADTFRTPVPLAAARRVNNRRSR